MELSINQITKKYGKKVAVNAFEAMLTEGVYGLLGPNGSGKTTLMRMICGILRPTEGNICLDGNNILFLDEQYRALLGYLPQNFGYYPNYTGWDFMMYFATLKGLPKYTAEERSTQLLQMTGLYDVRKKKLKTYSGGMRQRIGIAQALLNDPKVLVLDEPTAGLDPRERAKFRNIISNLSGNRIILLSTHIVSDIEDIADHILLMKNGTLALNGKSADICEGVCGMVWECSVPHEAFADIAGRHIITRLRHTSEAVELRVIAQNKPSENAVLCEPCLEDLYLYYFEEERNENYGI